MRAKCVAMHGGVWRSVKGAWRCVQGACRCVQVRADACKCVKWLARTCVQCHGLFSLPNIRERLVQVVIAVGRERKRTNCQWTDGGWSRNSVTLTSSWLAATQVIVSAIGWPGPLFVFLSLIIAPRTTPMNRLHSRWSCIRKGFQGKLLGGIEQGGNPYGNSNQTNRRERQFPNQTRPSFSDCAWKERAIYPFCNFIPGW